MKKRKEMSDTAVCNTYGKNAKALIDAIKKLSETQGLDTVFTTFLELTAVCLRATSDPEHREADQKRYQELIQNMTPETIAAYAHMELLLYSAISENKEEPCDVLGAIYNALNLYNEWKGQFFTPDYICRFMGQIVNPVDEDITEENGYVSINEPACGSGAMIIGAVWAMQRKQFDYQNKSLFVAQDIDIRCVWMTYIQAFMYRIPAVVIHGNTLTLEEWSEWITPHIALPLSRRTAILEKKKEAEANESRGYAI